MSGTCSRHYPTRPTRPSYRNTNQPTKPTKNDSLAALNPPPDSLPTKHASFVAALMAKTRTRPSCGAANQPTKPTKIHILGWLVGLVGWFGWRIPSYCFPRASTWLVWLQDAFILLSHHIAVRPPLHAPTRPSCGAANQPTKPTKTRTRPSCGAANQPTKPTKTGSHHIALPERRTTNQPNQPEVHVFVAIMLVLVVWLDYHNQVHECVAEF